MTPLKTQAIQTALIGEWEKAIIINQEILDEFPDDVDTLNRLAFAYSSTGETKKAKSLYQKVLSLDTHNPIALRNLKRINGSGPTRLPPGSPLFVSNLFIEEPGKTKVVELINVADKKTQAQLYSGEKMELSIKRMKIFILGENKQYAGMLPDDLSKRLIRFIEGGNVYEVYIKNAHDNKITVFIRETKRATRLKNQPSFVSGEKSKMSFKAIDDSMDQVPEEE